MKLCFLNGGTDPSLFVLLLMNMMLASSGKQSTCPTCYPNSTSMLLCKGLPGTKVKMFSSVEVSSPTTKEKPLSTIPIPGPTTSETPPPLMMDESATPRNQDTVDKGTSMTTMTVSTQDHVSSTVSLTVAPSDVTRAASTATQHPTTVDDRSTTTSAEEQKYTSTTSSETYPVGNFGTERTFETATPLMGKTPKTTTKLNDLGVETVSLSDTTLPGLSTKEPDDFVKSTPGVSTVLVGKETTHLSDLTTKTETTTTTDSETSFERTSIAFAASMSSTMPTSTATSLNTENESNDISSRMTDVTETYEATMDSTNESTTLTTPNRLTSFETTKVSDVTKEHMETTKQTSAAYTDTLSSVKTESFPSVITAVQGKQSTTMEAAYTDTTPTPTLESSEAISLSTPIIGSTSETPTVDTTPVNASTTAPDVGLTSHAIKTPSGASLSSKITPTTTEAPFKISQTPLEGQTSVAGKTILTSSSTEAHRTIGKTHTSEVPKTPTISSKSDATSSPLKQFEKVETKPSVDLNKHTETTKTIEHSSTMVVELGSQRTSTEKPTKVTDQSTGQYTPPTSTSSTRQQTDDPSASTTSRPLTSRSYKSTADRNIVELFSKSVESAIRTKPKSNPAPKPSTTPVSSKLPKQTSVTNYVATTKTPVLLLETTKDRSMTTRVPDSVTFVNTFATGAPTTSRPSYCDQPCPDQFWDSGDMCYLLVPRRQSSSYIKAISYCQTLSDKTDMAWARDFANATLNEQFTDTLNGAGISSLLVYYNEKGSKEFRANKKVNVTSLSKIYTKFYGFMEFDFVINDQIIDQPVDHVRNDISAFCRTPRYCQKNRCAFSDFVDAQMDKIVGIPMGVEFLQEGDQVVLPCIRNDKAQTVRTRCSSFGTWVPHPSLLICDPPAHPIEEEEVEFEGNPRLQTSCAACYKWGTNKCVRQDNGLFKCVCKPGWRRFTCWKSPNMCANITSECGPGKCRSLVDMYDCLCPVTFFGDKCQYNKTSMTLFGKNNTVAYMSWGTMGQITMTTTNLLLLFAKLCGKFTVIEDPEDPQETYLFLRKVSLSAAGFVAILWKNPQMLGVDSVSCRFFWTIINHLYTYAIFMAANEAINFYTVVDGLSRNWWGNYEGKYKWYFSYRYRVYYAMFALAAYYGLISAIYWTNLVHPWTCLSSFVSPKDELWLLTTCMMLTLGFFGLAFGEAGCLVMQNRPHGLIKVKAYFEHLWPCHKWILTKVIRNKFYAPLMPMVLFFQWYYLVRSTDEPCFYFEMMAFLASAVYAVLNVFQTLHCCTGWLRTQYVIFVMCYLPKWMSPEYEEESWRNREEILAKHRPSRYAKEQQDKKDAVMAAKDKERDEIRKKNQELLKKTPDLPQRLLYHVPEDGPEQCETVSLEMDMTQDCYIPDYKKTVFLRRWTRMYLEYRMRAYTVKDSLARVLMEEMRRGFLKKHGPEHDMEIRLYNHWCHTVPDRDHIKVRNPHQDRVFIMPEGPPERLFVMKFDRLINRVVNAARQGLFMPVRPRRLPENPDVREFKQVLDFMKWQFPNKLDTLDFETADGNMHPQEQTFLKGADVVIEEQFEEWDAKLKEAMEIESEKFDKVYEDDVCFSQYVGTPFEEHAREIFNVQPKFCPDGERLANPRNRPIDNHFQDDLMPGFIGPSPRSRVNLGPYDEFVKKAAYYQGIVDGEWEAVRGNAAIQRRDRHMRTGRGEFEGNFDNNWRGKAKMYLWRLIAKDD